ncbi:MAG: prephenate/arogenate dehydrogenase [Cyanobacteriota bacterium]|jgi:arogenate dehydrogenase (NADP+)
MEALWSNRPVGIVGLGLIGGSLGLDLQALGVEVRALVHREATAERARQRGLATRVATEPEVLRDCGLVVLALPLDRLLAPDPGLVQALPPQAVLTDVGSVKEPVGRCWQALAGARFVPGHPMAGTAQAGVEAGVPGLFRDRPWVATPSPQTDPAAVEAVRSLAEAVGARWLTCGAEDHDRAVALISHLPVLVGAALLQTAAAPSGPGGPSPFPPPELVRALASSGFADTTRVGGGNPELGLLMARCNREALLAALDRYRQELEHLDQLMRSENWDSLAAVLQSSQVLRPEFVQG